MDQIVHCERLLRQQWLLELPHDLLWRILGFLDVRSLCTARLVCKQFRQSASGHVKALQLDCTALEQPPTSTFTQLSGLTRLAVSVGCAKQLHLLTHPLIGPIVTHVDIRWRKFTEDWQRTKDLDQLALLPNLRSLALQAEERGINLLPVGLEKLHIKHCIRDSASLTRFTGLRSLRMSLAVGAGRILEPLTELRNLRSLKLFSDPSAVHMLSTFTMLTALSWEVCRVDIGPEISLHSLARLTALSRLTVFAWTGVQRHEHLACLSLLTRLTHLDISQSALAPCAVGSSFLVPLTGLVSLGLKCSTVGMSLLPSINVEALQSLTLMCATGDVSVLQRATGLTRLDITSPGPDRPQGLESALPLMTRLRSLRLLGNKDEAPRPSHLSVILQSLTSLTRLVYSGPFSAGSDLSACASLPSLRSLWLMDIPEVTPACLPALQAMSGLTELSLSFTGIGREHVTLEDRAAFDVERLRRGWPRLTVRIDFRDV